VARLVEAVGDGVGYDAVVAGTADGVGYHGVLAETYDAYRPRPPLSFVELLCCLARCERPPLVVDLGSGTGLSTEIWASRAEQVVGVEPDARMRALALGRAAVNVVYVDASGEATGLDDSSADVVTACCSMHWMERERALAEIARILKPGGVFAACDVVSRMIHPQLDPKLRAIEAPIGAFAYIEAHAEPRAEQIRASDCFRFVCDLTMTGEEEGDADRVVGLVLSHGQVARRLASGEWTERSIGLRKLRRDAQRVLGDRTVPFAFTYRVCVAIR
jgi:ubiquinone/menaquinone biosynthesis C-methylase UbiE